VLTDEVLDDIDYDVKEYDIYDKEN